MSPDPKPSSSVRPTKKQKDLLEFIGQFIAEHGYSPSYREIMSSLNYTSVATVALHVGNLIKRGHLQKRGRSARSLELTGVAVDAPKLMTNDVKPSDEKWLVEKVEYFFRELEGKVRIESPELDKLYVLIGALKVLGLDGAAQAFIARLTVLKVKVADEA
jgi:LexA DNA binding domain